MKKNEYTLKECAKLLYDRQMEIGKPITWGYAIAKIGDKTRDGTIPRYTICGHIHVAHEDIMKYLGVKV